MPPPHMRKRSVSSFQSQPASTISTNGSVATVKHDAASGANGCTSTDGEASPQGLKHDRSLSSLESEIRELRTRCESLEKENAGLKTETHVHEAALPTTALCSAVQTPSLTTCSTPNLTGYASSESSETAMCDAVTKRTDNDDFKSLVFEKFDIMTRCLQFLQDDVKREGETRSTVTQALQDDLKKECLTRAQLAQEVDRVKKDATWDKGRIGSVEKKMKEVLAEFEELTISTVEKNDSVSPSSAADQHGQGLQQQLDKAVQHIQKLSAEVDKQADDIDDLQTQLAGGLSTPKGPATAVSVVGEMTAADYAAHINGDWDGRKEVGPLVSQRQPDLLHSAMEAMKQRAEMQKIAEKVRSIQSSVEHMKKQSELQRKIDGIATKDGLYFVWRRLNQAVESDVPENEISTFGPFTGRREDFVHLRNRVTRRIATHDIFGKAEVEAKRAEVGL